MEKIFISILILLAGCKVQSGFDFPQPELAPYSSNNNISDSLKKNDPSIDIYQNEFLALADSYNSSLINKTVFSVQKDFRGHGWSILGQCLIYDDANLIVVDSSFWKTASDFNRRSLVFHELGHCLLGRGHRTIYYQGLNRTTPMAFLPTGIT